MIRQLAAVACLALACTEADSPRAGRIAFDIPAGPAIDTLIIWQRQAHTQMLLDYQTVEHAGNTRALRGEFDKFEALRRLTTGTHVQFDIVNDNTIVVAADHF